MKLSKQNLQQEQARQGDSQAHSFSEGENFEGLATHARRSVFYQLDYLSKHFAENKQLGIAVSGGSDSLGLLKLCSQWSKQHNWKLSALTIDHDLRQESASEAKYVESICNKLNLEHTTLKWDKPASTKITQETCRQARHVLFTKWAHTQNIVALIIGHTHDDRLETYLMRKASGSSEYGLAAMPSLSNSPIWPDGRNLALLRPANHIQRKHLMSVLEEAAIRWVCDPSNENENYERVRIRSLISQLPQSEKLEHVANLETLTNARQDTDAAISEFSKKHIIWKEDGSASISLSALGKQSPDIATRVLERLLLCVSGHDYPVGFSRTQSLLVNIIGSSPSDGKTFCLGGCWLTIKGDALFIYAMPAKRSTTKNSPRLKPIPVSSKEKVCFQGRFDIKMSESALDCKIVSWDTALATGYQPPQISLDKKAQRSMPVAIIESTNSDEQTCLPMGAYRISPLHRDRFSRLERNIFVPKPAIILTE